MAGGYAPPENPSETHLVNLNSRRSDKESPKIALIGAGPWSSRTIIGDVQHRSASRDAAIALTDIDTNPLG